MVLAGRAAVLRGAEPRISSSNRSAFENEPIGQGCRGRAADSPADAQCRHSSAGSPVSENRQYARLMDWPYRIVLIRVMPNFPEVAFEEAMRQEFSFSSHAGSWEGASFRWPAHPHKCCEFSYPGPSPVNYNRSRDRCGGGEQARALRVLLRDIYSHVRTDHSHAKEAAGRLPASHAGLNPG